MLISENIVYLLYFDSEYFRESEWYFWEISPTVKMFYVVVGILGPLGLKLLFDKVSSLVVKPFEKKKETKEA